jgi:FkbM family methyltransferase
MRKIFIDCGTNMGMGFSKLSDKIGVDETWEVYGFEPNIYAYNSYLNNINSGRFEVLKNKNITLFQKAVWDKDEKLIFCHESVNESHYNENTEWKLACDRVNDDYIKGLGLDFIDFEIPATGGSCVLEMKEKLRRMEDHNIKLVFKEFSEVDSIDLSKWILDNFSDGDLIVLKMDIEGSEYKVLPKMINDNSINLISTLIIEWHDWQMPDFEQQTIYLKKELSRLKINIINWG